MHKKSKCNNEGSSFMSNISNLLVNSKGSFYTPLDLQKDNKGNITSLAFDLDKNGQVADNEIVTDGNKDGKITTNEILDFVVNKVQQFPQIQYVINVLDNNINHQEEKELSKKYIDLLANKSSTLVIDGQEVKLAWGYRIGETLLEIALSEPASLEALDGNTYVFAPTEEGMRVTLKGIVCNGRIMPNSTALVQGKNIVLSGGHFGFNPNSDISYLGVNELELSTPTELKAYDGSSYTFKDTVFINKDGLVITGKFVDRAIMIQGKEVQLEEYFLTNEFRATYDSHGIPTLTIDLATPQVFRTSNGQDATFTSWVEFDGNQNAIGGK